MNIEPQLIRDEAYEVYTGCPTLTFVIEKEERSVPYSSFKSGTFVKDAISLTFEAGSLAIRGKNLRELWRHLQLQDVRSVKCNEVKEGDDLQVIAIAWGDK